MTPRYDLDRLGVRRWSGATLAVFAMLGTGFGTWLSRLPAVRDHLGASTLDMSYFALILSIGSLVGLSLAGHAIARLGAHRMLTLGLSAQAVSMTGATLLLWADQTGLGMGLLFVYGFGFSTTDVAINITGAEAERALGKPRMPSYHGAYSLGAAVTMGIGAAAEAAKVPVPLHVAVMFAFVALIGLTALRWIPRDDFSARSEQAAERTSGRTDDIDAAGSVITGPIPTVPTGGAPGANSAGLTEATAGSAPTPRRYSPWRDSRIYLVGLVAVALGLAEGTGTDWISLALVDGRGFDNSSATLITGVFFTTVVVTRFSGSALLSRFGRVAVVRAGALACALGVVLVILVPASWAIVLGTALWGAGCALGFPVAISAAADDPKTAARSVAAVSVIAYSAYLVGPPLIGFLGEHFGLLAAFWPVAGAALLSLLVIGAMRRPRHLDV